MHRAATCVVLLGLLGACEGIDGSLVNDLADASNNQKMDQLCQESDALVDRLGLRLDDMSNDQAIELSRLSRERRYTCNNRDGEAIVFLSRIEVINAELETLERAVQ